MHVTALLRLPIVLLLAALAGCSSPPSVTVTAAASAARPVAGPHDAFVLLSGGGTPLSNQYSQYLQAQAMTAFLQRTYPAEAVWVFFGMGYQPGAVAALNDVHRQVKTDGLLLDTWLTGTLPRNRPATKQAVLQALKDEILPRVAAGGTLYLFVGDHGSLSKGPAPESNITLWQLEPTEKGGWRTNEQENLTVSELRAALLPGLGKGRVVFCMTQCHSGGFHFMGVPRTITGNPRWSNPAAGKAEVAAWAASLGSTQIAGFAATDEASLAAGCAPNPDPDRWAGYERFMPEMILGTDLLAGHAKGEALLSFAAAHDASTLIDRTIDKPLATSEQFLERWADWIERTAAKPGRLDQRIARQFAVYEKFLAGRPDFQTKDRAFQARQDQFARFTAALAEQNPAMATLLREGTRAELLAAAGPETTRPGRPAGQRRPAAEMVKRWTDVIRPAWKAAVEAGEIKDVPAQAIAFEKFLLGLEAKGNDFSSPGRNQGLLQWTYWQSSLAFPQKLDQAKADAVTRWAVERRWRIGEWAKTSADPAVRAAALQWAPRVRPGTVPLAPARPAGMATAPVRPNATAAERVIFYRRVLGAWAFLLAVEERTALDHLQKLIDLEALPYPVGE